MPNEQAQTGEMFDISAFILYVSFALNVWVRFLLNNLYAGDSHLRGVYQKKLVNFPFKDDNLTGTYGIFNRFLNANF